MKGKWIILPILIALTVLMAGCTNNGSSMGSDVGTLIGAVVTYWIVLAILIVAWLIFTLVFLYDIYVAVMGVADEMAGLRKVLMIANGITDEQIRNSSKKSSPASQIKHPQIESPSQIKQPPTSDYVQRGR